MLIIKPDIEYAVIDAETTNIEDGEIPKTLFWGYADAQGYKDFKTSAKLCKFLRTRSPKVLLHHSNFDIIQLLVDGETDINILRSHGGKIIRSAYYQHTLQNTLTVFPTKLEKIFNAFGYKKTSLRNLAKRNYEDCVNGLDCFLKLDALIFDLIGIHPLQAGTVAGTTFRAAEKHAGKMPKDLRFKDAYRGGRVEVFDTREHAKVNRYDIHSSYPASFIEAKPQEELWKIKVKTKDWYCPFFDGNNFDMLLFPNGEFSSWVFKSNFERYLEPNFERTKIKIISRHKLDFSWICMLKSLVEKLYELKANSKDEGIKTSTKFLLNAFYGRIGLSGKSERVRIMEESDLPDGEDVTSFRLSHKRWICFDTVEREPRSNFAFSAFITDNARSRLFESFVQNRAIYGDTDSTFTLFHRNKFRSTIGNNLGEWGFEGCKRFCARNVKDYEFGEEEFRKGGSEHTLWNLRQFAEGKTAQRVLRERKTSLRKRLVLPNGETEPLTVNS